MTTTNVGLHNLERMAGARKAPKRVGRGESSGHGKTSGRGHKGQKARKSGNVRIGFEGGQNPLARRLPKRGFKNFGFRKEYKAINIGRIADHFHAGAVVDPVALVGVGLLRKGEMVKVLGVGELKGALTVKVHAISKKAQSLIEGQGGSVELLKNKAE